MRLFACAAEMIINGHVEKQMQKIQMKVSG